VPKAWIWRFWFRLGISNYETRKYHGEPEKLAKVKRILESTGVIFLEENGEAWREAAKVSGGDLVRFRAETRVRYSWNIAADEVGRVVEVEPHPPMIGPIYTMRVKFASCKDALPLCYSSNTNSFTLHSPMKKSA
jgi:hypothetical protein